MSKLHPRNPHQDRYDIELLCRANPALKPFVTHNPSGEDTINFSNADAVLALNKALLMHYYDVTFWEIPAGFLCPPIPGRADYIHYAADLLATCNGGKVPVGKKVRVLDVGTGANVVYPIVGSQTYGWQFVGTDVNPQSLTAAKQIVNANPNLKLKIDVVEQRDAKSMFKTVIPANSRFALTVCNPPFHKSASDAIAGTQRKNRNLNKTKSAKVTKDTQDKKNRNQNFGGQSSELWCEGGEMAFIAKMIEESASYQKNVLWFSCLVSKNDNLSVVKRLLNKQRVQDVQVINMAQGQKVSRFVAWSFVAEKQRQQWFGN